MIIKGDKSTYVLLESVVPSSFCD